MKKALEAKIIEIKDGKVALEIEKQKLVVDLDCLPEKVSSGQKFKLYFLNSEEGVSEKKLAKSILEEILNGK